MRADARGHHRNTLPIGEIAAGAALLRVPQQKLPERHLGMIFGLFKSNYGLVVELNSDGKIIGSYHDPDGSVVPDVSQVR